MNIKKGRIEIRPGVSIENVSKEYIEIKDCKIRISEEEENAEIDAIPYDTFPEAEVTVEDLGDGRVLIKADL